jgi:hypothetical protein
VTGRRAFAGLALVALAAGGYFWLRPTDESKIRAQLAKLAETVRVKESDGQANPVLRYSRINDAFTGLFEEDVRVSIPELTSLQAGRAPLVELATSAPRFVRMLDVDLGSITVKLDETATSAAVGATANLSAVERDGEKRSDRRAIDARFVKRDGAWIVATLTVWDKADARP